MNFINRYHQLNELLVSLKTYGVILADPVTINTLKSIGIISKQINNKAKFETNKKCLRSKFSLITIPSKINYDEYKHTGKKN